MGEPLTVGELIGLLEEIGDKDLLIYSEGCDCVELAFTINLYEKGIILERQQTPRPPRKPLPTLEELTEQATKASVKKGVKL